MIKLVFYTITFCFGVTCGMYYNQKQMLLDIRSDLDKVIEKLDDSATRDETTK